MMTYFKRKPISEQKHPDRKKAERAAWKWFSLWIRIKDANGNGIAKCFTCNTHKHYKKMNAGHFKPQGHYKGLKFDERNVRCQCVGCNMFRGGRLDVYARELIREYGINILDDLMVSNRLARKMMTFEYREMEEKYKALVKARIKEMNPLMCSI